MVESSRKKETVYAVCMMTFFDPSVLVNCQMELPNKLINIHIFYMFVVIVFHLCPNLYFSVHAAYFRPCWIVSHKGVFVQGTARDINDELQSVYIQINGKNFHLTAKK